MKKTLIILVLFLVGFSNPLFADKLPTSLFGVPILNPYEESLVKDDETWRMICENLKIITPHCIKDFIKNESFEQYIFYLDSQRRFNHIRGWRYIGIGYETGYNADVCYKEKTNLVEILSTLYEIDKSRFSQKYFKISWEGEEGKHIALYDKSFIKYNKGNDELVLNAECWYGDEGVNFMLELLTEELFLKSNEDLVEIDSINLEVFNTDLSGY